MDTADYLRVRFTDLSYYRPETWQWDFGDGATFEGRKPYWHTFPKSGTYEVCLTVSNENGSDTLCRTLVLGTSATGDVQPKENLVDVFPTPRMAAFCLPSVIMYLSREYSDSMMLWEGRSTTNGCIMAGMM